MIIQDNPDKTVLFLQYRIVSVTVSFLYNTFKKNKQKKPNGDHKSNNAKNKTSIKIKKIWCHVTNLSVLKLDIQEITASLIPLGQTVQKLKGKSTATTVASKFKPRHATAQTKAVSPLLVLWCSFWLMVDTLESCSRLTCARLAAV